MYKVSKRNRGIKLGILLLCMFSSTFSYSQKHKPFQGKLVYSIEMADTAMQRFFPVHFMVVYTNDTLVRIENETSQLGKQVVIKHLLLNKSILLLENKGIEYAIQTDLSKSKKNDSVPSLRFRKRLGKVRFLDFKANKVEVSTKDQKRKLEILYFKHLSSKYIDAYDGCPGLPVRYFFNTEDGVVVYTLIQMEEKEVSHDLFGVPSTYKRVTFDEFLDAVLQGRER